MNRHWLIIYDIRDEKRLRNIAKIMGKYAVRVQYSVFEMNAPESILKELRRKIKGKMEYEDFVVYFKICNSDWQKRIKYGRGKEILDFDFIIV